MRLIIGLNMSGHICCGQCGISGYDYQGSVERANQNVKKGFKSIKQKKCSNGFILIQSMKNRAYHYGINIHRIQRCLVHPLKAV